MPWTGTKLLTALEMAIVAGLSAFVGSVTSLAAGGGIVTGKVAIAAIGGVPIEILYDPIDTAVTGQEADGHIVYNRSLLALAKTHGLRRPGAVRMLAWRLFGGFAHRDGLRSARWLARRQAGPCGAHL